MTPKIRISQNFTNDHTATNRTNYETTSKTEMSAAKEDNEDVVNMPKRSRLIVKPVDNEMLQAR